MPRYAYGAPQQYLVDDCPLLAGFGGVARLVSAGQRQRGTGPSVRIRSHRYSLQSVARRFRFRPPIRIPFSHGEHRLTGQSGPRGRFPRRGDPAHKTAKDSIPGLGRNDPPGACVSSSKPKPRTYDDTMPSLRRRFPRGGMNDRSAIPSRLRGSRFRLPTPSPAPPVPRRELRCSASRTRRPLPPPAPRGRAIGAASACRLRA